MIEPGLIGPGSGCGHDGLARDLGPDPGLPRAIAAYADASARASW